MREFGPAPIGAGEEVTRSYGVPATMLDAYPELVWRGGGVEIRGRRTPSLCPTLATVRAPPASGRMRPDRVRYRCCMLSLLRPCDGDDTTGDPAICSFGETPRAPH